MASRDFGVRSVRSIGSCPSRASAEASVPAVGAATLVDDLLPRVPVRQWVLTRPYRLRYCLAWDHTLCRAVLGVYARTLLAFYARTARGLGIPDGQTGTVTVRAASMHRTLDLAVLAWLRCGGRLRIVATIQDPAPCARIPRPPQVGAGPRHPRPRPQPDHTAATP
jgi:hypothetical protein